MARKKIETIEANAPSKSARTTVTGRKRMMDRAMAFCGIRKRVGMRSRRRSTSAEPPSTAASSVGEVGAGAFGGACPRARQVGRHSTEAIDSLSDPILRVECKGLKSLMTQEGAKEGFGLNSRARAAEGSTQWPAAFVRDGHSLDTAARHASA